MVDTSGQQNIRGIDIQKLAVGFAEEDTIFKRFVKNTTTSAREIRWYQKTAGFLTATTPALITNVSHGSQPFILENSTTRNTSYVRKYFVESPILTEEDIKDSDIDTLAMNLRDLTRAVEYAVDGRVWDVLTESRVATNINWITASGAWNLGAAADPMTDIMNAQLQIRKNSYNPMGGFLLVNASGSKNLLSWLINTKGSSIPSFAAARVQDNVLVELLGLKVYVSQNVTSNFSLVGTDGCATWKSFTPITARTIEEVGIGTKIRVWEEGECILTDPKGICLISGSGNA